MEEKCEKFLAEIQFLGEWTGAELMKLHPELADIDEVKKRMKAMQKYARLEYKFELLRKECSRMFGFEIGRELSGTEKRVILGRDERRDGKIK